LHNRFGTKINGKLLNYASIDAAAATPRDRFLRQSDVLEKIGFGESMLNEMIASGSFPQPARIGRARSALVRERGRCMDRRASG
jgi:predicted DNA-binding transcriptional regulator AlpA